MPRCEYFGECGGCTSQHIDYGVQVANKRLELAHATGLADVSVESLEQYGYRSRMDFIFLPGGLGLRRKGSWKSIVRIKRCEIANAAVNSLLAEVQECGMSEPYDLEKKNGTFRYAVIRACQDQSSVSFVLNPRSTRLGEAIGKIEDYAKTGSARSVTVAYVLPEMDESVSEDTFNAKGEGLLRESYLGKTFAYSNQGFFQNNHCMAERMHAYCRQLLLEHRAKEVQLLDLYGGVGTFGIINADLYKHVISVESYPGCKELAMQNARENGARNFASVSMDSSKINRLNLGRPLHIITDPPRSGMDMKTIERMNSLSPDLIIYVSCNLGQLKKDLRKFPRYDIKSACMFDMFPNTPHSEAVVELVRR